MPLRRLTCATIAALLCSLAPDARAVSEYELIEHKPLNLSLGAGFEFETGDYGTDQTVDTWRVPLLVEWAPRDRFSLAVEIPYVYQSSTGETVLVGGMPAPVRPGGGRMAGSGPGGAVTANDDGSESGLGDITLDAAVTVVPGREVSPRLLALLYAKLPTADEDKGLGTGEFDGGAGLGIGKRFGPWSAYAEALYILPGSSDSYDPDDYWEWLAALSVRTGKGLRPGVALSGGTAPFDGADDPLEVKARLSGLAGERGSFSLYLARGLSDASPDWGVGIFGYLDF